MTTDAMSGGQSAWLRELGEGWGKIFAHEGFGPDGPTLEVDFMQIENLAGLAVLGVVQGMVREAVWQQGLRLGDTQPCPDCGENCPVEWEDRPFKTRFGEVQLPEPSCHCSDCRRNFFPSAGSFAAR